MIVMNSMDHRKKDISGGKGYGGILILLLFSILLIAALSAAPVADRTPDAWGFSRESGFYDEPFDLMIYAPYDEIYYTLDGSEPDRDSVRYTGPVHIYDATDDPNVYSMIPDVSLFYDRELKELFMEHRLEDDITSVVPDYVMPGYNVSKCRVIRAVYYDDEGNKSDVLTGSYFVGKDKAADCKDRMMISLVMDPEDLFDSERGIYVMGNRMDEFLKEALEESSGITDEDEDPLSDLWEANYTGRGPEWEREASVQFFQDGRLILGQQAGVRIKGGFSREYDPKSLNLYARSEYDGNRTFDLGGSIRLQEDKLTLYNGGEDIYSKLKDPLMAALCSEMDFATMSFTPCDLYIDGEYRGYYFLTEQYDKKYIENRYHVDDDNVIMIKDNLIEEGVDPDLEKYQEDMLFLSEADMTVDENYRKACRILDMESFTDYMAAEIYIARWLDWPGSNFEMWRTRLADDGEYGDCRWRMMLFDVNWGGMTYKDGDAKRDSIAWARGQSPLLDNLLHNDGFRQDFTERLMSLRDNEFAPDRVDEKTDELVRIMDDAMNDHYRRFFASDNGRFHEEAEELKRFFRERRDFIPEMITSNFE